MRVLALAALAAIPLTAQVHVHGIFEGSLTAAREYADPLRDVRVTVVFSGPEGASGEVDAFWDGGRAWRFRFSPETPGAWRWRSSASPSDSGLGGQTGSFTARPYQGSNPLYRRGAPRVSPDGRYFVHADGTPWFWMGDTAWNGALLATAEEWPRYLADRAAKRFSLIQLVLTQWRAGRADENGRTAFQGVDKITIDPAFFERMDRMLRQVADHGLVSGAVLLWALTSRDNESPGEALPVDQATLLARYMVARYDALPVIWLLGGDGDYRGEKAEKWRTIGRAVFPEGRRRRPVTLHPRGTQAPWEPLKDEPWVDFFMYQSGHGNDARKWRWNATEGMAVDWRLDSPRPVVDGEINYEDHIDYHTKKTITPYQVRRAAWYSLLAAPPAGFTYGAHGIWPWHREAKVPLAHERAGIAQPWTHYLDAPGALHMKVLAGILAGLEWWKLRPDRALLQEDDPAEDFSDYVMPARAENGDFALLYLPGNRQVTLDLSSLRGQIEATWIDPRTGRRIPAERRNAIADVRYEPPSQEDWLLLLRSVD